MTSALRHKDGERNVQDIYDSFEDSEKDLLAVILGAAIEDEDLTNNPEYLEQFNALSPDKKNVIDFVVGNAMARQEELEHSSIVEVNNFLAHYGVKGMQWGVRRDRTASTGAPRLSKTTANTDILRRQAREKVRTNNASLKEAHVAALKSNGHRVFNAFTGDKTFWKRQAQIAAVGATIVGASMAAPMVLPAATLAAVGTWTTGSAAASLSSSALTAAGAATITTAGVSIAQVGGVAASQVSQITNLGRAIRGNARIDKSYESLGKNIYKNQYSGSVKVQKTLNKNGSIPKRRLRHDGMSVGEFLSHHMDTDLEHVLKGV